MILVHSTLGQHWTPSSCQHFCCWKTAFRQRWLDEKCLRGGEGLSFFFKDHYVFITLTQIYLGCSHLCKSLFLANLGSRKGLRNTGLCESTLYLFLCLKLYLTVAVSIASCERSFSKLKLIKFYLRLTMGESRLSALAILSIESDFV